MLTITRTGLAAIASAEENGFKISIKTFRLSEYTGNTNVDYTEATDLYGVPVYTGEISLAEILGTSTVKLTLEIPREVPLSGTWYLREVGLYLDTGELFAIGALQPTYEKNNSYGIRVYVAVTAQRLGAVVSVNVGNNNSLPAVPQVRALPAPIDSDHSVMAVLDQQTSQYGTSVAGLASRSGPGLLHWSFIGHNRIYHGVVDEITDQTRFKLSYAAGGFWLNANEIVIGQITAGSGAGQSRKLRHLKATEEFVVVDEAFERFDLTSTMAIWRDNANQLPARTPDIPEYMVLGHGLNSWKRVDPAPATFYTYEAFYATSVLNAESQFGSEILEPPRDGLVTFVWCDGKLMAENAYSQSWNIITVYGKPYGTKIDIMMFKRVETTGAAGILNTFESKHTGDGQTKRFHFSIVPKSEAWVAVYVNGQYVHHQDYDFEPTSIVFRNAAPAEGAEVLLVQFGLYDDTMGSCITYRTFRQIVPGETVINMTDTVENPSQVLVFVDGKQYSQNDYQLLYPNIKITTPPVFEGGSSYVDVFVFLPEYINQDTPQTYEGLNTGPQWIDPAGAEGPPNKLVPKTVSFISDGAQTIINVPTVPNGDHVLVFADGEYVQRELYSYSAGRVILNTPVPSGRLVDVVAFTEVTVDGGFEVQCTHFNFTSSTDTFYQLASVSDPDWVIVTVAGKYQHKLSYQIDPQSRIFFQGMEANKSVEVWYYNNVPREGFRTTLRYDKNGGAVANSYPLFQQVERQQNVLTFVDKVKYDNSQYSINAAGDRVILNPNAGTNVPVICVSFRSAVPKSRLLTREEYNRSVVSFNYRTGAILLTREDVRAVLHREDVFALLTDAERAVLAGQGGGGGGEQPPSAQPGNTFTSTNWTVPEGVYRIRAVIIAGGGQGGGASNDMSYAGHGGKRGEVLVREFDVVPGQQLEVRLGVGGSSYLYTMDGATVYPQPGDPGTSNGSIAFNGRNGGDTIFHQWVAIGGLGGVSEPAYGPTYRHADAEGEGQVSMQTGTGNYTGGGMGGTTGVKTQGNDEMVFSYPGTNGAFGWSVPNSTGGGYNASVPGAGGGGAAADPNGVGAFGGAGQNGVVYISWGF